MGRPRKDEEGRQRLQMDLSKDAYEQLQAMGKKAKKMGLSDSSSKATTVRNALRLYEWFIKVTKEEGNKLILAKDGETPKEVELLFGE